MKPAAAVALLMGALLVTGAIGAIASAGAPSFYARLDKPSWASELCLGAPRPRGSHSRGLGSSLRFVLRNVVDLPLSAIAGIVARW